MIYLAEIFTLKELVAFNNITNNIGCLYSRKLEAYMKRSIESQTYNVKDDFNNGMTRLGVQRNNWYSSNNRKWTEDDVIVNICAGCSQPIMDRHFLSLSNNGKNWHLNCLVCTDCRLPLDRELTCYTGSDERIYCRNDYFRRFATSVCSMCRHSISSDELVIRIDTKFVYHRNCFACVHCGHLFIPGQHYALSDDGDPYCPIDFERHIENHNKSRHSLTVPKEISDHDVPFLVQQSSRTRAHEADAGLSRNKGNETPAVNDIEEREAVIRSVDIRNSSAVVAPISDSLGFVTSQIHDIDDRPKIHRRSRSSFDKEQLRLMTLYFHLNQNPDMNDLQQLAIRTGVNKRVLQVWFQNARAKYRRRQSGCTRKASPVIRSDSGDYDADTT